MAEKLTYWMTVFLSVISIVLLIGNIIMIETNHGLQDEATHRQSVINDGVKLTQFDQSLVNLLADLATKNDDRDIRALLTTQGITIAPAQKSSADDVREPAAEGTHSKR